MRKTSKGNLNFELKEDTTMEKENLNVTLINAVIYGDVNGVKNALKGGANVNELDHSGKTALHHVNGKLGAEIAKLLVDAGADVNARNIWGATPLHEAVSGNNADKIVQFLINAGADVNASDDVSKRSPLDKALREAHSLAVIKQLVAAGAKLKHLNHAVTLLHRNTNLLNTDKELLKEYIKVLKEYAKAKRKFLNLQNELQ